MGKLRIAIVGCGGIANQKHMPSIKTQADNRSWKRRRGRLHLHRMKN